MHVAVLGFLAHKMASDRVMAMCRALAARGIDPTLLVRAFHSRSTSPSLSPQSHPPVFPNSVQNNAGASAAALLVGRSNARLKTVGAV